MRSASRRRQATKRKSTSPNSSCVTDDPAITRIVWLFSFVLGFSRLIWARFVLHQDMQTVLRCHMAACDAIGGIPNEILYDCMKTAVIGEAGGGSIVYNRALIDFARHYGYQPKACRPNRALAHQFGWKRRIMWPISTRGNKPENDDPSIIEPIKLPAA